MENQQGEMDYSSMLQQLQQQARQLETSAQVSRQLTAALDMDELLLQVVELIKGSFDYYHVHVYLLDPESGYLIMREGTGEVGSKLKARGHRLELGRGMVGTVGQAGEPLLAADVTQQPNWVPNPLLPETRSELSVPLQIGDRILGVLDVQSNEVGGLTETDLSLMESLGQQIAVAVENALLFRETRAVSVISRAVSSGLGIEEFLVAVSRELKATLDFDYMTIATYYEIVNQVELVGVDDRTDADIPLEEGVQLPIDLCVPGMAIQQNRSIVASDLTAEPFNTFIDAEILTRRGMRSVLSVPLVSRGRVVGAINLVSARERAFTAADAHLMEQISGQLAAALENAQIFENIQRMVDERTSESAIFRTMVENSSEAIALANVEQILTYANPTFYRVHGYDPETEDLTRRPLTSFILSEDEGALSDELRDHVLGGRQWRAEKQHLRKDGTLFDAVTTVFAVRGPEGEPLAVAALTRDVTSERKIMAISQVASSTPELDRLAPLVLEHIASGTDIDRAVLILYEEIAEAGPQTMSLVAVYDPERGGQNVVNERMTAQESPFSTVVYHERKAVFVADVTTDERLFEDGRALLLGHGILSMLALPIMVRDKVVGMVGIDWRKHVELTYEQIALYQAMVNQVSTAVENARLIALQQHELEQALDRRVREVATSVEVAQAIASAPELKELFHRVVTLIKERFGYYHAHVYQVDRERNELEMMAGYGEPGRIMRERGHRIPVGIGLTGTAAETGQPVRVADVSRQPTWLPNPLLPDTRSELAVPIKLGEEVLGVLDVQSDKLGGLDEDDELLLLGLCGQIAVSIQNTRILGQVQRSQEAAQRRAQQLELSAGVSERLTSNLDLERLLSAVVNLIRQGFDYYHVHVYLVEEETGDLVMMEGSGDPGAIMKERGHRIPAGKGLVGLAAATGTTVLVSDVSEHEGWLPNPLLPDTRSELSVPLKFGEQIMGVLDVQDDEVGGLTLEDQALLEGLAGQIAIAVQNARIFGEIGERVEEQTREVRVFQALAENAADAVAMANLEGSIFFANAAWYELYGYDGEEGEGTAVLASEVWPREAIEWMDQAVLDRGHREWRGGASQLRRDGTQVAIDLTLFVVRDAQGDPIAVAALGRDVTIRKMTDQVTRLVSAASSQGEIGVGFLRVVMQGVNADRGSFVLYEGEDGLEPQRVRVVAAYDDHAQEVLSVDQIHDFARDPVHGELYRAQRPIDYDDLSELDPQRHASLQEAGIRSWAAFPLVTEGERVGGALILGRQRPLPFTDEADLLSPMLQQVSLGISNLIFREAQEQQTRKMLMQRTLEVNTTTEVAQAIASAEDLDELFRRVVTLVKERFDYYHVHVYQIDPERGDLVLAAGYGEWGRTMKERGHRIPMGTGLTGTAAQTKEPVLVPDVSEQENWLPNPLLPDTRSELAIPILMGDEVLGVLDVQDDEIGGLTQDAQVLLLGLCGQIATAIQNTRLLQETQGALDDVNLLYETSQAISMATTREAVNEIVMQRIMATNVDYCEILLYERRERGAQFIEVVGSWAAEGEAQSPGMRYKLDKYPLAEIAQRLGQEGTLVIGEEDVASQAEQVREWFVERNVKALALVPLKAGEEYIGFLSVERHKSGSFGLEAIRFYGTIASQSAATLRNIQFLEQSRTQLDELQRSYNDVARLASTVRQLSSPVIQVWEDVLVLPLVGAIGSQRAARIMEDLLTGITRFQAEQVIIDITGVPVMDTTVANYLMQTIKAASLLGARCMLVGINSEMAQTIVGLGLDLSSITTYSNLRAGIQAALRSTGYAITPLSPGEGEELL